MKHVLILGALLSALSASAVPLVVCETNQVKGVNVEYRWNLEANYAKGTVSIKSITPKLYGACEIPGVFIGTDAGSPVVLTVSELADNAFANHVGLTKATLPSTLTRIGSGCFDGCTFLAEVTIPYGVRAIGARAFSNTIITGLEIPDSVINLEGNIAAGALFDLGNALADSSHFLVTTDGAVYNKDQTKLYACPTRTEGTLTLPDTLTEIGEDAFFGCFRLTYLSIPANVNIIGANAFNVAGIWNDLDTPAPEATPKLKNIFFNSNLPPTAPDNVFEGVPTTTTLQTFSASWPTIWKSRTVSVLDPTDPNLPTLTYADAYGIEWQYRFIPSGISIVGLKQRNTTGHTIYSPESEETDYTGYKVLDLPRSINGCPVTKIADGALSNCNAVVYIRIPQTITEIGASAFKGCSSLTALDTLETSPGMMDERTINIPSGVRKLGYGAFEGLTVAQITLPTTLTEIDGNPALGCEFATTINVATDNPKFSTADGVLYDKFQSRLLGVPANQSVVEFTIQESVTALGPDAFNGCMSLTSIKIPATLISVEANAFRGCAALTTLTFPASITTLGSGALAECPNLISVTFQGKEPTADDTLFTDSPKVNVTAKEGFFPDDSTWHNRPLDLTPSSIDPIGTQEYEDSNGILWYFTVKNGNAVLDADATTPAIDPSIAGELIIPESLDGYPIVEIPENTFARCGNLTTITLPASVTNIADTAFNGCTSLVEIVVSSGNKNYKTSRKCLYTADGSTLVRVPSQLLLPCTFIRTTIRTQITTVTTPGINDDGTDGTVRSVENQAPVSEQTAENVNGDISFEMLLRDVSYIANYAFFGCNVFSPASSIVTNLISSTSAFKGTSVCVRQMSETVVENESVKTYLELPETIQPEPNAFTGSGITITSQGETPILAAHYIEQAEPETLTAKSAYVGWIEKNGKIAGTVTLTTGAEIKGLFKISGMVVRPGEKRLAIKSLEQLEALGDVYLFQNLAKSKDKTERATFNSLKGKSWTLAFLAEDIKAPALMGGAIVLNATVGTYGTVTIRGFAPDGTPLAATAQMIRTEERTLIPVVFSAYSSKGGFAILLEVNTDGSLSLLSASSYMAIITKTSYSMSLRLLDIGTPNGSLNGDLQLDEGLTEAGYSIDWNKIGWKPRLTSKTGLFTGTITVFNKKGKNTKLTVRGVLVNGVGYGSALLRSAGSWFLRVSP